MKKTYIFGAVLVLVLMFSWFLTNGGRKAEAPIVANNAENKTDDENIGGSLPPVSNTMPVPEDNLGETEEMLVSEFREFVVSGKNFSFDPDLITVKRGDKVKIIFKSTEGFHDFVIDEYGVATKQLKSPGEEVLEFIANKTGTFEYYCSVGSHRAMGMFGTLKVE